MWQESYLENQVLSADPVELVCILYRAAIGSVREARAHLAAGEIRARSMYINRALTAVGELYGCLDMAAAGDLGRSLASLYLYIRQRLTEANIRQLDGPLAESERLLTTLYEGWQQMESAPPTPAPGPEAWASAAAPEMHSWSA